MSNAGKPVGPEPSLMTEKPKRKRGRPRKQPQETADPLPPKKPRGRPKGSKKLSAGSGQMVHASVEKGPGEDHENGLLSRKKNIRKGEATRVAMYTLPLKVHLGKDATGPRQTIEFRRSLSTSLAVAQ